MYPRHSARRDRDRDDRLLHRQGAFGRSAKIEFDLVKLEVTYRLLAISGHYRVAGAGNSTAAIVTATFVSILGAAFITGHSATLSAGGEWRAVTAAPMQIALDNDGLPARAGFMRASAMRAGQSRAAVTAGHEIPLNSAYVATPAEIFLTTLPPRP